MKNVLCLLISLLIGLLCIAPACAIAESIDLLSMTYDDLLILQTQLEEEIESRKRQYAIENGNRVITLDQGSILLFPNQTQTLNPSVERVVDDAPEKTSFIWTSSDPAIAKVSNTGIITAVTAGEAIITCTAADDEYIFACVPISVVNRVSNVALSDSALTLHITAHDPAAAIHLMTAAIEPVDAYHQTITWSSSNEEIATVNADGTIQVHKPGAATITATSTEPASNQQAPKKASCKLTVVQDVEEITLNETALRIKKGTSSTLKATLSPENATNKAVTWESSDPAIATVSATGQITAKTCGICTITCTAKDGSNIISTCEVTVYQPVTSLKPEKTSVSAFIEAKPTAINMTVSPEDATDKTLIWTSSDESIATVDESGNVHAVSGGSCKITCTAADGSGKTVNVSVLVPSISVDKTDYTVTEKNGLTIPLKYFGQDIYKLKATIASTAILTAEIDETTNSDGIDQPCLKITPERAGKTTITLNDSTNAQNAVKLNIEVMSSAVYDSTSYPTANYKEILRYPDKHDGKQYQIYGKVLQKMDLGFFVRLLVNVNSNLYAVDYFPSSIGVSVIEDDYVTIYGTCTGTYSYETVRGNENTIPSLDAEKIKIGRK